MAENAQAQNVPSIFRKCELRLENVAIWRDCRTLSYQPELPHLPHQLTDFEATKDLPAFALFWEMGLGKTKTIIDTACYLYEHGKIDGVVVIAPNRVHRNWLCDELPKHLPQRLRGRVTAECWESRRASTKRHQRAMAALLASDGFAWLLGSYDGRMTERGKAFFTTFLRKKRCLYVLDESQSVKTPGAKRTKSIVASGRCAPYRRIASGTPITQAPFDVYAQIKFLDATFWADRGFASYSAFKAHFGRWLTRYEFRAMHGYDPGYDQLIEYQNLDQLNSLITECSSRRLKEDHLDLPPKIYTKRYFDLAPKTRKLYEELRTQSIAELESGAVIDGSFPMVRVLRLQQIACGYAVAEDEPAELLGPNPRIKLLSEICEDVQGGCIIWARFRKDIDQIMELLGDRAVRYDGACTPEEADAAKDKFTQGDAQFFVGNTQKGGTGLTLTRAKTVIYYSNNFRLGDRLQSEDRAHRIGQDVSVTYIDLVANQTVDTKIVTALREKRDMARVVTGDTVREWI